jgi:hypothetical protein
MASECIPPPLIDAIRVLRYAIVDAGVRYARSSVSYRGARICTDFVERFREVVLLREKAGAEPAP